MKRIHAWKAVAALVATLSIFAAPIAQAVRLDSSGSNDEYVGVSNYAFSYSGTPLYLTGQCFVNGAKDSFWKAPASCDSSGENCWATACDNCNDADAYLSMGAMRKAYFHYYASDHKASGQGDCLFSIGSTSFSLSFAYEDTGEDFTLSLQKTDPGWQDGGIGFCTGNNDAQKSQTNTICNEDYIVSLSADPSITNGAGLTVINNPTALEVAVQAYDLCRLEPSPLLVQACLEGFGLKRATTDKAGVSSPPESAKRRRLANRVSDEGRWLIASDSDGEALHGVLVSGADDETVEFATCIQSSSNDDPDPARASYAYLCDFLSEDGTSTRNQRISLPGSLLRARPLTDLSKTREVRAAGTEIAIGSNAAIRKLASRARVSRPRPPLIEEEDAVTEAASPLGDFLVWHAATETGRIAMIQSENEDRLEIVRHSPLALSPSFTVCSGFSEDEREIEYLCSGNLRCTGSPCPEESWSVGTLVDFPRALFKPRPCLEGQGYDRADDGDRSRLRLSKLGQPGSRARLRFDTSIRLAPGEEVRPDKEGFRFLVEDAEGNTVVDLDLPPNSENETNRKKSAGQWRVSKGGRSFRYRSQDANGGIVPKVKIKRTGKRSNEWSVRVSGRKGTFGDESLALPLAASLSLDPPNPNSTSCSSVDYSQTGRPDCRVRGRSGSSVIDCRSR
jgi:hypothetical protein